ncbi:MAG: DUF418 domain-containing protein [Xanthomonadales bacterium]|nr:DUF418 domain-containing protein [Xanthomonadales bacterium]MBK7145159.1 DUF418 domain-containing protein [Xanthomonadales bacterium]MCC6561474.1 DUF418 domain-containing protein [Xanthomonadales bacterium]
MTSSPSDQRIEVLDVLRGFALGGILLANILWLSGYLLAPAAVRAALHAHPLDQFFLLFTRLFVHGKSYSIFSFLFGLGVAVQMQRAEAHQEAGFTARYGRRLLVLFLIGWAHAYFLWWGDILRFYALIGAFLLLFRHATNRTLLTVALLSLLAPVLLAVLRDAEWMEMSDVMARPTDKPLSLVVLAKGDWAVFRDYNLGKIAEHAMTNFTNGRALKIFGLFLLGLHCGRSDFLNRLREDRTYLRHLLVWGGLIGMAASLLRVAETYGVIRRLESDVFEQVLYLFAVYPLAAAYVALIVLGCPHAGSQGALRWLAPVGKMALSNYIFHSIAAAAVFHWWGLGLAGSLPLRHCYALALIIFVSQTICSRLWLRRFHHGPLEWIWRTLTLLKRVPLLRSSR